MTPKSDKIVEAEQICANLGWTLKYKKSSGWMVHRPEYEAKNVSLGHEDLVLPFVTAFYVLTDDRAIVEELAKQLVPFLGDDAEFYAKTYTKKK